jgi:hypothetical protein
MRIKFNYSVVVDGQNHPGIVSVDPADSELHPHIRAIRHVERKFGVSMQAIRQSEPLGCLNSKFRVWYADPEQAGRRKPRTLAEFMESNYEW